MQTTGDGPDVDYKSLYEQEQLKNLSLIKEINKLKQVVEKYESNQSQEATYNKFFISDPSVNEEYESLLLKYENCLGMKDNELRNGYNSSNPLAALRLMDQSNEAMISNFNQRDEAIEALKNQIENGKYEQTISSLEDERTNMYREFYNLQKNSKTMDRSYSKESNRRNRHSVSRRDFHRSRYSSSPSRHRSSSRDRSEHGKRNNSLDSRYSEADSKRTYNDDRDNGDSKRRYRDRNEGSSRGDYKERRDNRSGNDRYRGDSPGSRSYRNRK